jgi:hypothetical protein
MTAMENTCCDDSCQCDCSNIPSYKMCQLSQPAHKFNLKKVKKLTSNPAYICKCCGRTANNEINLCSPTSLK